MSNKKSSVILFLAFFVLCTSQAEILTWRANTGQQYETKVTLKESVTSLNAITTKPVRVTVNTPYQETAAQNQSTIPYLRSIPSFPRNAVQAGSAWTAKASVIYDLSAFGYEKPVIVDVPVSYTLLDLSESDSRTYYHIRAVWYPFQVTSAEINRRTGIERLSGYSVMDLYWDNKAGSPKRSTLSEEVQYRFNDKSSLFYKRDTSEDIKTVTDIVRAQVIKQLNEQIQTQKVANVDVKQSEEGVILSIENIQFEAESAVLVAAEKTKLTNIGKMLSSLKNRKLSIVGHAANIPGSDEKQLLDLSTQRAQSVANFLVESGIKAADSVVASGMGGTKPIASNDTADGRSKNRRVEIIIMDEEAQQ